MRLGGSLYNDYSEKRMGAGRGRSIRLVCGDYLEGNTVEVAGVMSSSAFHGSIGAKNSSNLLTLKLESN